MQMKRERQRSEFREKERLVGEDGGGGVRLEKEGHKPPKNPKIPGFRVTRPRFVCPGPQSPSLSQIYLFIPLSFFFASVFYYLLTCVSSESPLRILP